MWSPPLVSGVLCLLAVVLDLPSEGKATDPVLGVLDGWPAYSGATRVYWLIASVAAYVLFAVLAGHRPKVVATRTALLVLGVVALSALDVMSESTFAADLAKATAVFALAAIGLLWAGRYRLFALWGLVFSVAVVVLTLVDGPRVPLLVVAALAVLSWRARSPWLALVAAAFLFCAWAWSGAETTPSVVVHPPSSVVTSLTVSERSVVSERELTATATTATRDVGIFGAGYATEPTRWDADEVLVPGLVLLMAGLYRLVVRRRGTAEAVLFGAGLTAFTVALTDVIAQQGVAAGWNWERSDTNTIVAIHLKSQEPLVSSPVSWTVLAATALGVGLGVWAWLRRSVVVGTTTVVFLATLWTTAGSTEFFAVVTPSSVLLIGAALAVLGQRGNPRDNSRWAV